MMGHWHYSTTQPFFPQGKETTRLSFYREERSQVGILIREGLQNALDARVGDGPVRVSFRQFEPGSFDASYLEGLITSEFRNRLRASGGPEAPATTECSVLVIEDFGTKGLLGDCENPDVDGDDQNWNAFWHREGEGAKPRAANGGAGQGKVTYFAHSKAAVVFGLTVRSSDHRRLLMGRAAFPRDYQHSDGIKYSRATYFTTSEKGPLPVSDAFELDRFSEAFRLSRKPAETGLSLVVPFAKPFSTSEAIRSVVLDFYMPISAGRMEVAIGEIIIDAGSIDEVASRFVEEDDLKPGASCFTGGYREFARAVLANSDPSLSLLPGWNQGRVIPDASFPAGSIERQREALEAGERVSVRLPLTLKKRTGEKIDTYFDVFLETPEELERNQEAFVRQDLLIGGETHITAGTYLQKTRSLTWIRDGSLSEFLLSAEEPTHLKWNASLAGDKAEYIAPDLVLRSIRQAVPRLLNTLLTGKVTRDFRSLARYFSRPVPEQAKQRKDQGSKKPSDSVLESTPIPVLPTVRRSFKIETDHTAIRVSPNGSQALEQTELPVRAVLEFAYEGLDLDPFAAYDPFDFDLAKPRDFSIKHSGIEIGLMSGNRIEFNVNDPAFSLEVDGFDRNVRLRSRLRFDVALENDEESMNG